ncbi:MAG: hypothetical protein KDK70_04845 [Myxococcales bacterium]|nr:hypothetical protein [Myxococcales bacterium]
MKAVIIGLGAAVTLGAGWYLVSSGDDPKQDDTSAVASDDAPKGRRREKAAPREGSSDERFEPRRDGTLEERVARLEDEVATLRRQLALRGRVAVSGGGADVEAILEDPVLDQQVRSIVEQEREAERERRDERRAERFAEMREEVLDELVKVASLSDEQRESIGGLWQGESERIGPLIEEGRSGERSFREIREEIEGIHKETDDAVRAMLSEAQFEHYDELRPRGPGGRGRGGDRGDRGGGGGRDGGDGRRGGESPQRGE